jgi:hypothetical protein
MGVGVVGAYHGRQNPIVGSIPTFPTNKIKKGIRNAKEFNKERDLSS